MQKLLNNFRAEIDKIDNQIIDLLEIRMSIINEVAKLKKEHQEKFFIKQAREADMIKNLISRPNLKFSKLAIVDIWRKIITAANMHEQPLVVALHNPRNIIDYNYLLFEYYNNEIPIIKCDSAQNVIAEIENGAANIGVFALPGDNNVDDNWWINIAHNKSNLRVFAKIPFLESANNTKRPQLVAVAEVNVEKSLQDNSLLCIELSASASKASLVALLKEANLDCKILKTTKINQVEGINFYLVEVNGFIDLDDEVIKFLNSSAIRPYVRVIGHYARPIVV
jgi:chorismate mutase